MGFLTKSATNQAVQPQKIDRDLQFLIYEVEGLYYLCGENKGADQLADQLRGYRAAAVTGQTICAFVFAYAKSRFSHDVAHMIM